LLYHESDLRIEEHYTDTAGFTDHVFAMMLLLGFRFAPRIRDLADKRLYVPGKEEDRQFLFFATLFFKPEKKCYCFSARGVSNYVAAADARSSRTCSKLDATLW